MLWIAVIFVAMIVLLAWLALRWLVPFSPGQSMPNTFQGTRILPYPTPCANSSGNVAAAAANATLPANANLTTFIEGFDITGLGATAASEIVVTITGLTTACDTPTFNINIPAGITTQINASSPNGGYSYRFPTPLPGSAINTAVVVNVPSFGAGNTNACCTAYGFQA